MDNSCVPYPPMFPRQSERLLGDRHLLTIRATSPIGLPRFTVFPLFLRFSFLGSSTGLGSQFSLPSTIWAINRFGCSARVGFTKAWGPQKQSQYRKPRSDCRSCSQDMSYITSNIYINYRSSFNHCYQYCKWLQRHWCPWPVNAKNESWLVATSSY